ncbi:MAG TPA: DNA mismatch repair protein MutS [Verrucomicrobiales bacterium]|nr:DNA mismatch repair protein MutS [Verrucomicrobiales bacterium]
MMAQYRRIKAELPKDALLLFRLGDFYELFFEDAQLGSQLLNLALTKRNGIPMCGLPYHAANTYLSRLLKQGRKVAICDQTEEARPGKLVQREVTAILSPGTHFDERLLNAERNNFLAAIYAHSRKFGFACVDLTTGDFRVTELDSRKQLMAELDRLRPAEIILPTESRELHELVTATGPIEPGPHRSDGGGQLVEYDAWTFLPETAVFTLREHFKVASLDGFGLQTSTAASGAAGAILHYLVHHLRRDVAHLTRLTCYQVADFLILDSVSLRNLEVLEPLHGDGASATTLFRALHRTVTPMGARRLRDWLTQPLASVEAIHRRQEAVAAWLNLPSALVGIRARLTEVRDLERTLARLSLGSGNARDLLALRAALEQVPELKRGVEQLAVARPPAPELPGANENSEASPTPEESASLLDELEAQLWELPALIELLARAIADDPPLAVKEGGLIRSGYSAELDELQAAARGGKDWIAQMQQDEVARTGIPSLKVGFNSVFGYYIEVTKANLAKVPPQYVRKQTVANGERFITPELKTMESKILGAEERATQLEYELFLQVREEVLEQLREIQQTASAIAQLDVLAAFAETARLHAHVRPEIGDEGVLWIRDGRHPVLEQALVQERFVPNDVSLDLAREQIALITGPNMAGKSTYIRQVALITLLAHTGAYVPAKSARIDLVDRIFTRIGASDDLARGQSTFMVEMSETANILNNATRRSLVILDEIGRGTSTFDGLSLAWSIVEHLHHQVGAKTLFATHYHELTELGSTPAASVASSESLSSEPVSKPESSAPVPGSTPQLARVRNYHVAVREWNDQLVFLRQVRPGPTDKSHGIQVARLAGVPKPVIERAKVILRVLEEAELNLQHVLAGDTGEGPTSKPKAPTRRRVEREKLRELAPSPQLDLFSS